MLVACHMSSDLFELLEMTHTERRESPSNKSQLTWYFHSITWVRISRDKILQIFFDWNKNATFTLRLCSSLLDQVLFLCCHLTIKSYRILPYGVCNSSKFYSQRKRTSKFNIMKLWWQWQWQRLWQWQWQSKANFYVSNENRNISHHPPYSLNFGSWFDCWSNRIFSGIMDWIYLLLTWLPSQCQWLIYLKWFYLPCGKYAESQRTIYPLKLHFSPRGTS